MLTQASLTRKAFAPFRILYCYSLNFFENCIRPYSQEDFMCIISTHVSWLEWVGRVFFSNAIIPGQKWWPTLLGREISCSQWEGIQGGLLFFLLSLGVKDFFFIFLWFPICSFKVPNGFPSESQYVSQVPNVFPNMFSSIALLTFIPYTLASVVHLLTYIGGPKGRNIILQNRTFYFGEPP
jgi:hypothetical protein